MEFLRQLGQLISAAIGSVVISIYYAFESLLFGAMVYFVWNLFDVGGIVGLGAITYFQAVGALFIYKVFRFNISELTPKTPMQVVIPKELTK